MIGIVDRNAESPSLRILSKKIDYQGYQATISSVEYIYLISYPSVVIHKSNS